MIGPDIPAHLRKSNVITNEEDSSDDDYGPSLPPELASSVRPTVGPSFPTYPPIHHDDEDDDTLGPMPLPAGVEQESDPIKEFMEKEERRRKNVEESQKVKAPQREEWMLAPPVASDILSKLADPTKLKARQFSRNTEEKSTDQTLWTETPAERQKRLSEEISGKRKRTEIGASGAAAVELTDEERKRRKRDQAIEAEVERHNREMRGSTLIDMHSGSSSKTQKEEDMSKPPAGGWDRDRDMALGGRLMDDSSRSKIIKDARNLGDRFGRSSRGGFL